MKEKDKALKAVYGEWGMLYREQLLEQDKEKYYLLLCSGELHEYITKLDVQTEHLYERIVKELKEKNAVSDALKRSNPNLWKKNMDNICKQAKKIVNENIIHKTEERLM